MITLHHPHARFELSPDYSPQLSISKSAARISHAGGEAGSRRRKLLESCGENTPCTTCPENSRVDNTTQTCVECSGGSTRASGDNPLGGVDTHCGCAIDERVVDNTCTACPAGTTRASGDDPLGGDTFCDAVLCSVGFRVNGVNACVACAEGSVNDPGDDASGDETHCACPENFRVDNTTQTCVACSGNLTRASGDNPLGGVETRCGCAIDERVVNNNCTACPAGTTRASGDDPLGGDTFCDAVLCSVGFRVNGVNACVACAEGSVNDPGDDASGDETHCACPENFRVDNTTQTCVACSGNLTRASGDNPLGGVETRCGCAIDERVVNNNCTACPAGTTRAPGDDPLGFDTVCDAVAYVELLVVNDKARCDAFGVYRQVDGENVYSPTALAAMHAHTAAVVASVGTIFAQASGFATKMRITLVGQEDWCEGDRLDATYFNPATHEGITRDGYPVGETDIDALLSAFGIWRDVNLGTLANNDVAHLFTGRDLVGSSLGGAYQYSACSDDLSYCGAMNPEDNSKTMRSGDCAFDSSIGTDGATVCCYGRKGGAVSAVADPLNAHTDETGYTASSLVFESALIVSHHLGKQLGMDIDGTGDSVSCPETGYVMASRTTDDTYRPVASGAFSKFSRCSAATYQRQIETYTCLFKETNRSTCGNGVVEGERGEECDCGGGSADGVCALDGGSFHDDAFCNATTCLFVEATIANAAPPPQPSPPPARYEPDEWCDAGCGEARVKGFSVYVTDVPWNKCLRCTSNYLEEDCSLVEAPYKGWVDDEGRTRETACSWTGCVASGDGGGCDADANETASASTQCFVGDDSGGSIAGTNTRCCQQKPLWSCCGLLSCVMASTSPPPPFPPPSPAPPPPSPPFPPPPPLCRGDGVYSAAMPT